MTSGTMLYFAYKVKKTLDALGIKTRLINVIKFSRPSSEQLRAELQKLIPPKGVVFTVWDGDKNVLFERVAAAVATNDSNRAHCVAFGPTEESDANGSPMEVMSSFRLRPSDILREILGCEFLGKSDRSTTC